MRAPRTDRNIILLAFAEVAGELGREPWQAGDFAAGVRHAIRTIDKRLTEALDAEAEARREYRRELRRERAAYAHIPPAGRYS